MGKHRDLFKEFCYFSSFEVRVLWEFLIVTSTVADSQRVFQSVIAVIFVYIRVIDSCQYELHVWKLMRNLV